MNSLVWKVGVGLILGNILVLAAHGQDRLYVNAAAGSGGDGDGWATAYNDLQLALNDGRLSSGDTIWVAAGTYYPSVEYCVDTCASTSRNKTFRLVNGVKIYGGFVGTEADLPQRNPELNETILSGNINQPELSSDNTFHVVTAHNVGPGTMLNGFTITGGNANDSSPSLSQAGEGGGMLVAFGDTGGSSPQIVRCKFIANSATGISSASGAGGAVFVEWQGTESGLPVQFVNCSFIDNIALHAGGAGYINGGLAAFTNCVFRGNSVLDDTVGQGGALAAPTFSNSPCCRSQDGERRNQRAASWGVMSSCGTSVIESRPFG